MDENGLFEDVYISHFRGHFIGYDVRLLKGKFQKTLEMVWWAGLWGCSDSLFWVPTLIFNRPSLYWNATVNIYCMYIYIYAVNMHVLQGIQKPKSAAAWQSETSLTWSTFAQRTSIFGLGRGLRSVKGQRVSIVALSARCLGFVCCALV